MRLNRDERTRVNSPTTLTEEVAILGSGAGTKLFHGKLIGRVFFKSASDEAT